MKSFIEFINESKYDPIQSLIELVESGDSELAIEVAKSQKLLDQLELALLKKYTKILLLTNTRTSDIFEAINSLQTIEDLDLQDKQLKELPKEIGQLKKLKELHVCEGSLENTPKQRIKWLREQLPNCNFILIHDIVSGSNEKIIL